MTKRVVVACLGDAQSAAMIRELSHKAEVIAVAFDLGGAVPLAAMRDVALQAGAVRCHAFDVREDFAREQLLPALHSRAFADPVQALDALAPAFIAARLEEIARLERATAMSPAAVTVDTRPLPRAAHAPVHFEIGFADGVPVSINGVEMTVSELMESIETITGEPALHVLDRELPREQEQFA